MSHQNKITSRILRKLDSPKLLEGLTDILSPSDINSLLMDVFSKITNNINTEDVLKNYSGNHFVKPSDIDPIAYHKLEINLLSMAQSEKIRSIMLSPVAVLGCCSSIASVNQNKIISALRGTEVLSDPTNMLAIHIAYALKNGTLNRSNGEIHLCTTHRATRVQAKYYPGQVPHFGLFCIVSSGEDTGSYAFEQTSIKKHLSFYESFFATHFNGILSLEVQQRSGYKDSDGFFSRIVTGLQKEFSNIQVEIVNSDMSNLYYKGINIKVYLLRNGERIEVGDCGFVDWTQKLLSRKKERMFISAIGLDRLLM